MPLLSIFASNPDAVGQLTIEQVVSSAGDGVLKDQSTCAGELRAYLGQIGTPKIASYIEHCLTASFNKGGLVLQDLVNELGRRLDYEVANGRYQGVAGGIGYDGVWTSPEGHDLVLEVKTTDAYRLSLDTLAGYRGKLAAAGQLAPTSSILIVVGRQDTGELEAQIRGSRHAWDVRVISAEALIKLVLLKENSEASETGLKIRSLLTPVEYTRLDRMVDVMFTTATDLEEAQPVEDGASRIVASSPVLQTASHSSSDTMARGFTDGGSLHAKREGIIAALAHRERKALVRKSRALYWSAAHDLRVACSISKRYTGRNQHPYWYAFHPAWQEFLREGTRSLFVLGCMDRDEAYAIPRYEMTRLLPFLNTTIKDGSTFWHIHIAERQNGLELLVPKGSSGLPLDQFMFRVKEEAAVGLDQSIPRPAAGQECR